MPLPLSASQAQLHNTKQLVLQRKRELLCATWITACSSDKSAGSLQDQGLLEIRPGELLFIHIFRKTKRIKDSYYLFRTYWGKVKEPLLFYEKTPISFGRP